MILWNNVLRTIFIVFIFFYGCSSLKAQDLYDFEHSLSYAEHLRHEGKHDWAADEYSRLVKMKPESDSLWYWLLYTHRNSGKLKTGIRFADSIHLARSAPPQSIVTEEYVKLLLKAGNYAKAEQVLNSGSRLDSGKQHKYLFYSSMLQQDWQRAHSLQPGASPWLDQSGVQHFDSLLNRADHVPRPSPWVAGLLSTAVPGLGKVYTGNWKDGAFAFVTVGLLSYSAYQGFSKKGEKSVYGWIFGGLAVGFYTGNIFGSAKAARRRTIWENHRIQTRAQDIIYSRF